MRSSDTENHRKLMKGRVEPRRKPAARWKGVSANLTSVQGHGLAAEERVEMGLWRTVSRVLGDSCARCRVVSLPG